VIVKINNRHSHFKTRKQNPIPNGHFFTQTCNLSPQTGQPKARKSSGEEIGGKQRLAGLLVAGWGGDAKKGLIEGWV
jgi:hypothetical protein